MPDNRTEPVIIPNLEVLLKKTTEILEILSKGLNSSLERVVKGTWIIANIFVSVQVIGVVYAVKQYNNSQSVSEIQIRNAERYEKTKNAIEAVNKVYNSEFINSLAKLKETNSLKNNETINALNLVFNTYSVIAIVYNNNIADNKIIIGSIKKEVVKFVHHPLFINSYTDEEKNEINKMVNSINNGG